MNEIHRLNPWVAQPLSDAMKSKYFRRVADLQAERVILGRSAIIVGWVIGAVGVACLAASAIGWVTILPLKTETIRFEEIDKSTGIIGEPVSLADAPRLFGAAVEQHTLRQYIEAREGYVPMMDDRNYHVVQIMNTPTEQVVYASGRKPMTADTHIRVENFRFHPLAISKDDTRRYLVQYERTVWHGSSKDATQPWSATVDFQWKPTLGMVPDDRTDNPGGFQVVAYSASSDVPDTTRK